MPRHRSHSIEFKRQVAEEFLGGETLHGLAKRHDLSRNLIRAVVAFLRGPEGSTRSRRAKTSRMPCDFPDGGKKSIFSRMEMIMSQISRFTLAIQRPKPLQRTPPSNGPG